ncbi:hypothetical protein [Streptomyces sp. NPDC004658]|uniref:hypothetical protein n=1 Tax=Streptomyces sp. NPDC004658 TaxID=3154672 RepID=UPI0033BE4B82
MTAGHEDAWGAERAGGHGEHGDPGDYGDYGDFGAGEQHEQQEDHGEYGGMDALMAAITGAPLPEEARRDPAFLAAHRAAEADVRVLRDQLARLAEALTGEETAGEETDAVTGPAGVPEAGVPAVPPTRRPVGRTRPAGPERQTRPRPGRPSGPRRALRIALGSLAGTAALSLVLGFGWLLVNAAGGADDNGGASAKSDAAGKSEDAGTGVRPAEPERELACARTVVEGTVVRVEPQRGSRGSRVTVTVTRSYKPAHAPADVGFLLAADTRPAPRPGQHVLVGVGRGERASLWAVGDSRVAAERAWITDALPGSRGLACPSGDES